MNLELKGVDLHSHTTASDGSLSPTELVNKAADLGLLALAVTDHDTVAGLPEAIEAATARNIELIPGVELSVEDDAGRYHLLGFGFDPNDPTLADNLIELRKRRAARNELIMQRSRDFGLPITWEEVRSFAGDSGEVIARPHFAAALLAKGVVSSIQEAFDKYLATGMPLYFPKDGLSSVAAVQLLHGAGGVAVMAHPSLTKWAEPTRLEDRLRSLRDDAGLDGVEAYYNKHTPEQTEAYLAIANRLDLIVTGGSDFHGDPKPTVMLGDVFAGRPAPASLLDGVRGRAAT